MNYQVKGHILWVDDEIHHLKPHILFLESKGYRVSTATNGNDADVLNKNNRYDLILLDQTVPGIDGMETLQKIKIQRRSIPVIRITKSEDEWLMDEAISKQVNQFLIKPVSPNQIYIACKQILEKNKIIDGSKVSSGDQLIALGSSGPHSNGYSLIRKVLEKSKPSSSQLNSLIEPTKIYVKSILSLIQNLPVHAISHITGGGLLENIPRVLPKHLAARLNSNSWELPQIFKWLQSEGNIDTMEMYRVLNCGVGMVVIVPKALSDEAINILKSCGENAWLIGEVIDSEGEQVLI
jgi:CheY-like chemotaxis protein